MHFVCHNRAEWLDAECATEVTQDHSDGGTAECQLAQHNLESTPEHLNEPQDNQDFESNSPDPSQPLLLSGNAQGNAASDSGSFDVPPLDGDVQRFTKQDTSNPCLSGEDGPAGAVEAMPVAESTMGNTAEHHVSDGGRRASAAHSVDSENLEPQLMQRMIGISTAPFQRLGRLKRGAHFGERDCLYGTEPAVSMVTVTACELYSLTKYHLVKMIAEWPHLAVVLKLSRTTLEECVFPEHPIQAIHFLQC